QAEANEWGQIVNLEPHAQYFVVRRPTAQMTREMSNQMMDDLKAFVAAQREMAEKQVAEQVEKRVDILTKEFESRVEKLEAELGDRAPKFLRRERADEPRPAEPPAGSAPGEMPMGSENGHEGPAAEGASSDKPASRKKPGKKSE